MATWKRHAEHLVAQRLGRNRWYAAYMTRIAVVERAYGSERARPRPPRGAKA